MECTSVEIRFGNSESVSRGLGGCVKDVVSVVEGFGIK